MFIKKKNNNHSPPNKQTNKTKAEFNLAFYFSGDPIAHLETDDNIDEVSAISKHLPCILKVRKLIDSSLLQQISKTSSCAVGLPGCQYSDKSRFCRTLWACLFLHLARNFYVVDFETSKAANKLFYRLLYW